MTFAKCLRAGTVTVMLLAVAVDPIAVFAQARSGQARIERGLCASLLSSKASERATAKLDRLQARLQTRRGEVGAVVASRREGRDAALANSRAHLEGRREASLAKMDETASSPSQKQAVAVFRAAVDSAIEVRQSAVTSALQEFRAGLDQARLDRRAAVDAAMGEFAASVKAAEDRAAADCAAQGANSEVIRSAMVGSIEGARRKMKDAIREADKLGEKTALLVKVRQSALDKAFSDYRQALTDAKDAFLASARSN
jgi:hypothetical protein